MDKILKIAVVLMVVLFVLSLFMIAELIIADSEPLCLLFYDSDYKAYRYHCSVYDPEIRGYRYYVEVAEVEHDGEVKEDCGFTRNVWLLSLFLGIIALTYIFYPRNFIWKKKKEVRNERN